MEYIFRDDLVLIFTPELGSADSGPPSPTRLTLTNAGRPMPVIPPGSKLWLSKNRAGEQSSNIAMVGVEPWAFSVRERQGGAILFGACENMAEGTGVPPIRTGSPVPYCSAPNGDSCLPGTTIVYSSLEVEADSRVTIRDGERAQVAIGGIPYTVSATARSVTGTPTRSACSD